MFCPFRPFVPALAAVALLVACGDDGGAGSPSIEATATTVDATTGDLGDDEAVAAAFFEAVRAGDRDAGAALASSEVVDFWEPWEPASDATFQSNGDGTFFIVVGGASPFQCTVESGVVVECLDEPTGDDGEVGVAEDLAVEPGGPDVVVEDVIVSGDPRHTYFVFAEGGAGQTLNVVVTALEDNASFFLYGPDGTELAADVAEASVQLDETGEYVIEVGPTRGNATYELRVNVAVPAG